MWLCIVNSTVLLFIAYVWFFKLMQFSMKLLCLPVPHVMLISSRAILVLCLNVSFDILKSYKWSWSRFAWSTEWRHIFSCGIGNSSWIVIGMIYVTPKRIKRNTTTVVYLTLYKMCATWLDRTTHRFVSERLCFDHDLIQLIQTKLKAVTFYVNKWKSGVRYRNNDVQLSHNVSKRTCYFFLFVFLLFISGEWCLGASKTGKQLNWWNVSWGRL